MALTQQAKVTTDTARLREEYEVDLKTQAERLLLLRDAVPLKHAGFLKVRRRKWTNTDGLLWSVTANSLPSPTKEEKAEWNKILKGYGLPELKIGTSETREIPTTRRTTTGYPWVHGDNKNEPEKWGAYESERELFQWVRSAWPQGSQQRCAEAELMDWADDITYAVHDLLDFYRAGQIPLDRLSRDHAELSRFFDSVFQKRWPKLASRSQELKGLFRGHNRYIPVARRYDGSFDQRRDLWQGSTIVISKWVKAIQLRDATADPFVAFEPSAKDEVHMFKELTWCYVILNNDLATLQQGQRRIVRTVFLAMLKAALNAKKLSLFPSEYQEQLETAGGDRKKLTRTVADFVASMTEKEITNLYKALCGFA